MIFDESVFPFAKTPQSSSQPSASGVFTTYLYYITISTPAQQVSQQVGESNLLVNEHRNASPLQTISHSFDNLECTSSSHQAREVSPSCFPISDNVARHSMITRSKVGIVKPNP